MILGTVRDHLPRIRLEFYGPEKVIEVEVIVDTGFDGDFVLPGRIVRDLGLDPVYLSRRKLADGTVRECSIYDVRVDLNGEIRSAEVVLFEHNPLIGTIILDGWQLSIDLSEGGDVILEAPD